MNKFDRWSLILFVVYVLFGFISNYVRHVAPDALEARLMLFVPWIAFGLLWIVFAIIGVKKSHLFVRDVGFPFDWKTVVLAAASVPFFILGSSKWDVSFDTAWAVFGVYIEEIVFRALLISFLLRVFTNIAGRAFWAILISSVLFTIVHIPMKSLAELYGIFGGSIIFGVAFYWSRSILFSLMFHAMSNAGSGAGLLAVGVYFVVAGMFRRKEQQTASIGSSDGDGSNAHQPIGAVT